MLILSFFCFLIIVLLQLTSLTFVTVAPDERSAEALISNVGMDNICRLLVRDLLSSYHRSQWVGRRPILSCRSLLAFIAAFVPTAGMAFFILILWLLVCGADLGRAMGGRDIFLRSKHVSGNRTMELFEPVMHLLARQVCPATHSSCGKSARPQIRSTRPNLLIRLWRMLCC